MTTTLEKIDSVRNTHIPHSADATVGENSVVLHRDSILKPFGLATLKDRYLAPGESSPQQAFMRAARAFSDDAAMADRIYSYASRLWFMFATPVLTNAPVRLSWGSSFEDNFEPHHFGPAPGLPISCFLNEPADNRVGLNAHYSEVSMFSSIGGGVGSYWGGIRSNGMSTSSGSESAGMVPFLGVVDREVLAFAQGKTRRASYAAYLDISHPEIIEFLEIRKPTGGDANRKCLNLHNGVCIPDSFMEIIERCMTDPDADDSWPLIDPKHKVVTEVVSAKMLWERIIELRAGAGNGEPFIVFTDTVNAALPDSQKALDLRVKHSNLCTEITLATNHERSAVCCLSSPNAETFDEWRDDPLFISDLTRFLDNVIEFFIRHTKTLIREGSRQEVRRQLTERFAHLGAAAIEEIANFIDSEHLDFLKKAAFSASQERSVGIGLMGFHSYLQSKMIPFESALASSVNRQLFNHIKRQAHAATRQLALERGEAPDARGSGVRNLHLLAVAPNASSSIICGGTSPSIEPFRANAFTHKTQSGSWSVRNPHLERVLERYGRNDDETWRAITLDGGSVRSLDFLTDLERDVFKTAIEIDQMWIIEHAATRQPWICQSQSVNGFFPSGVDITYLHAFHFQAWKRKLKTLYYLRSETARRADAVSIKVERAKMLEENVCLSCEG